MNKRANRVYWLLFIMMLILGLSMAIDGIRTEKHKNDLPVSSEGQTSDKVTETASEATSVEESTEATTILINESDSKLIEDFYSGQVFMGDSIMSGFAIYASKTSSGNVPKWLQNVIFLHKTSWKIGSAINDSNGPLYQGKSQKITDTLSQIKPERIFIDLGINEIEGLGSPGYSIEKLTTKYGNLISGIKAAVPDSKIYIISITPCTKEKETPTFSNTVIKEFNKSIEDSSEEWGVTFLDLAGEFGEALDPSYASDERVHHNDKSYKEKWVPFFEKVALNEIKEGSSETETEETTETTEEQQ